MRFGTVGRTGPGMRQVVGFGDRSTERGNFLGANMGRPIVTNGDFLLLGILIAPLQGCCLVSSWNCRRVGRARRAGLARGVAWLAGAATRPSCHVTVGRLVRFRG